MLFLIHYDRLNRETVYLQEYLEDDFMRAQQDRLNRELAYSKPDGSQEILLLQASSKEQLKSTHRKYFESNDAANLVMAALMVAGLIALAS